MIKIPELVIVRMSAGSERLKKDTRYWIGINGVIINAIEVIMAKNERFLVYSNIL